MRMAKTTIAASISGGHEKKVKRKKGKKVRKKPAAAVAALQLQQRKCCKWIAGVSEREREIKRVELTIPSRFFAPLTHSLTFSPAAREFTARMNGRQFGF